MQRIEEETGEEEKQKYTTLLFAVNSLFVSTNIEKGFN